MEKTARMIISFPPKNDDYQETFHSPATGDTPFVLPVKKAGAQKDELVFYGVVRDEDNEVVEGAAVIVFACYRGGIEEPLGHTSTDSEGTYIVNIPAMNDYKKLAGFKVRAGGTIRTPRENASCQTKNIENAPGSPNKSFNDFIKHMYYNPDKTLYDLMKNF